MSVMVSELYEALRKVGVDETTARAAAKAVVGADALAEANLVTKPFLKAELADLKADLLKWNVGALLAITALYGGLVAALKLFD